MAYQPVRQRLICMHDHLYFKLKELASLRGKGHVAPLVREIVEDYIRQHEGELLRK